MEREEYFWEARALCSSRALPWSLAPMDHHPLDPHLTGPRCLLSEAQASTETGADHHPGVQQQLSGEMVRRGLLASEPSSQSGECLALVWVSRTETQIWCNWGGYQAKMPHHTWAPFISALLWALQEKGMTAPSFPHQQQQYPHPLALVFPCQKSPCSPCSGILPTYLLM